ncbi:MAG: hypothetical protein FJY54_06305 [Betaproteobacteria bacterium]|nr:hypothetical protein [Betaproteobacteria bacterium]
MAPLDERRAIGPRRAGASQAATPSITNGPVCPANAAAWLNPPAAPSTTKGIVRVARFDAEQVLGFPLHPAHGNDNHLTGDADAVDVDRPDVDFVGSPLHYRSM